MGQMRGSATPPVASGVTVSRLHRLRLLEFMESSSAFCTRLVELEELELLGESMDRTAGELDRV